MKIKREKTIVKSAVEMRKMGRELAKHLEDGAVLGLMGELGSGKTTFVQGLAAGLGITGKVNSPTFNIMKAYNLGNSQRKRLYHVDCYRLPEPEDLEELGFGEWLADENGLVVVEWADRVKKLMPKDTLWISFLADGKKSNQRLLEYL